MKYYITLVCIILGITLLLVVQQSCSKSEYVYEEMMLIDIENSNKVKDMYSFDSWQVNKIKQVQPYIPERADITFVDRKGFVYFELSGKVFAIEYVGVYAGIIIYDLGEIKNKKRK